MAPLTRTGTLSRRALPFSLAALAALAALGTAGCGGTIYAFKVGSASNRVSEAKELGAEKLSAFEYYYAKEHLEKAMEEAAEADYSDAINLAEESEEYAEKAIRLSREAHRGAGR